MGEAAPYYKPGSRQVHSYLWPTLVKEIESRSWPESKTAIDVGCGAGATCQLLHNKGFRVLGIDPSNAGLEVARQSHPYLEFKHDAAGNGLAAKYGQFDLVVSLEVIEHCPVTSEYLTEFMDLMKPNALGVISTPYHGYWKNLALAISGKMDRHHNPLHDGGHVKFFAVASLHRGLRQHCAKSIRIHRLGRIPPLAKSMMAVFTK